jgi:hypothetical protein
MKADEKNGREAVKLRSGGVCEAGIRGVCLGHGHTVHHRKNRSQGGTWAPSNLLHLCGDGTRGCHGWITEHPATSYIRGWSVRGFRDPNEVPVLYRDGMPAYLDDAGAVAHCAHEDRLTLHSEAYGDYFECVDCSAQFSTDGGEL